MSKGEETRSAIVERAVALTSRLGVQALSIGALAATVGMSKSGLFAHFASKEDLQLEVLDEAVERFNRDVVGPALEKPRGVPRIRALFDNWLAWSADSRMPGGCIFIALSNELDDQPGPLRDRLRAHQQRWIAGLTHAADIAVEEGHFRAGLDTEQFAYDFMSVVLGCHHYKRLMRDPRAERRAANAFDRLIAAARP